jgi:hypothetical protein
LEDRAGDLVVECLDTMGVMMKYAPQAALTPCRGSLPLHMAAKWDLLEAGTHLLRAAPEAIFVKDAVGGLPIQLALQHGSESMAIQLACMPGQDTAALLTLLGHTGYPRPFFHVIPLVVAAHVPMSAEAWDLVPRDCPCLDLAIRAVFERGTMTDIRAIMSRLNATARNTTRVFLLTQKRLMQMHRVPALPTELTHRILANVYD